MQLTRLPGFVPLEKPLSGEALPPFRVTEPMKAGERVLVFSVGGSEIVLREAGMRVTLLQCLGKYYEIINWGFSVKLKNHDNLIQLKWAAPLN